MKNYFLLYLFLTLILLFSVSAYQVITNGIYEDFDNVESDVWSSGEVGDSNELNSTNAYKPQGNIQADVNYPKYINLTTANTNMSLANNHITFQWYARTPLSGTGGYLEEGFLFANSSSATRYNLKMVTSPTTASIVISKADDSSSITLISRNDDINIVANTYFRNILTVTNNGVNFTITYNMSALNGAQMNYITTTSSMSGLNNSNYWSIFFKDGCGSGCGSDYIDEILITYTTPPNAPSVMKNFTVDNPINNTAYAVCTDGTTSTIYFNWSNATVSGIKVNYSVTRWTGADLPSSLIDYNTGLDYLTQPFYNLSFNYTFNYNVISPDVAYNINVLGCNDINCKNVTINNAFSTCGMIWAQINQPCINGLRFTEYTETNNCYATTHTLCDLPTDNNTYANCTTPPTVVLPTQTDYNILNALYVLIVLIIIGGLLYIKRKRDKND